MKKKLPEKLDASITALVEAAEIYNKSKKGPFYFAGLSKSFEICLEYAWKYFKQQAQDEGIEVYSPKEAIKHAGRLGLIDNVEKWIGFLNDRNIAVHDYMGLGDDIYLKTITDYLDEVLKLR